MFYSRSNRPKTIPQPKCEENVPTFSLQINKANGKKELVESGKTNLYEKIQASKDATLIYNIIDRYNAGDNSVLNKAMGSYGNFTQMPATLVEAQQKLIDAERTFEQLPIAIREKYNNSYTEFLADVTAGGETKIEKWLKNQAETDKIAPKSNTQAETNQADNAQKMGE